MANLVIVALPNKDDYVNKISSQKIPHMTLLFLGELEKIRNFKEIIDFVRHATRRSLSRFSLEVDRRGELGEDQADVLFFSKSKWGGFDDINNFRSSLLQDNNIKIAYESNEQFPEWIPHMTLGYPDAPAKSDNRDYPGIRYVDFDRIAVWFGEFEGFEFPLKAWDWGSVDLAMSNENRGIVEDILQHYGVKGMRWGVRSSRGNQSFGPSRKERRANKKFEKKASSLDTKIKLNNAVNKAMTDHINRINAKFDSKYAKEIDEGVLFNRDHPITKRYYKEYNDAAISELNKQASTMTNASGTRAYKAVRNPDDFLGFTVISVDVKHADDLNTVRFLYIKDNKGRVIGIKIEDESLAQSSINNILEHYGVKGMKWGVRTVRSYTRDTARKRRSSEVSIADKGKKIKTSGGRGHPAHPDAVRARSLGQVGKKSGLKALSDKDLQDYTKRLNLEAQARRLEYGEKNAAKRFVAKLLGQAGDTATSEISKGASKQVKRSLAKKLAKTAVVASTA